MPGSRKKCVGASIMKSQVTSVAVLAGVQNGVRGSAAFRECEATVRLSRRRPSEGQRCLKLRVGLRELFDQLVDILLQLWIDFFASPPT